MTFRSLPPKVASAVLCFAAAGVWATEFGDVVSSTPVVALVPVTQQQCFDEQVVYQRPNSGAGALFGAIAGAAIGNAIGSGAGRAAATGIGMVTGAAIGDRAEANSHLPVSTTAQRCRNVTRYEDRTVGYDVVYDYQGLRRSVRMAQDPGDRIALEVNVVPVERAHWPVRRAPGLPPPVYSPSNGVIYDQPAPRVVYAPAPVYTPAPVYAAPPVYVQPWPYVVISGSRGRQGGGHGHRH